MVFRIIVVLKHNAFNAAENLKVKFKKSCLLSTVSADSPPTVPLLYNRGKLKKKIFDLRCRFVTLLDSLDCSTL
jgi:hypothetical protein